MINQKMLLVDALIGCGFSSMATADKYTKLGLATFTGNQWNESWGWNRAALEKLTEDQLLRIYCSQKKC